MKIFTKNHAKILGGICLLLIAIAAACTLKVEVAKPEIKVVIQLPDIDGSIIDKDAANFLDAGTK